MTGPRGVITSVKQPRRKTISLAVSLALVTQAPSLLAETAVLPEVTVTAAGENQSDGYRASKTRVGKILQDPHDVPQAITTVTRSLMDDQDAGSLREALRNVSGMSFNAAEGGRSGDNMNLRGFYTFGDLYLDGVRDTAQYNRELFNIEQVDVLRGAAAMLFGRGQAGGVINMVSKTPMLYGENKVEAGLGTQGYQELKADLNHRLGENSALRINLMNRDEGSVRKNPVTGQTAEIHRTGFAPSIGWGLGTDQELTLSHLYLKTADNPDYGLPFDRTTKRVSTAYRSTDYWGTNKTFDNSETNITTANHVWRITSDSQLNTKLRYANYQRAYWAAAPGNATNFISGGSAKTRQYDTDNVVLQSDYSTRFTTGGMQHELLVGVEYLNEKSKRWNLANVGNVSPAVYQAGVVGFVDGNTGALIDTRPTNQYQGDTYSTYVQDTVEFVKDWKLTAGVRRDEMRSDYTAVSAVQTAGKTTGTRATQYDGNFGENSYRLGLSWQPEVDTHYYISKSDSFSPTADLYQLSGAQYPAERSQVSEIGAKWLLLDGDLAFRAAFYEADKQWERNGDLEATASVLTRKRRTRGIEFELAGRISSNWEVFAGLSLMDPVITQVGPDQVNATTGAVSQVNSNLLGQVARNSPREAFNIWTTYKLGGGWRLGGGAEYKGKRYVYSPTNTSTSSFDELAMVAPGYVRWDAMVAYEQAKYTIKLNVQNLFDTVYYDALYDNGGFAVPGQRQRFILSTEYKF